jgi:hypothetical protein
MCREDICLFSLKFEDVHALRSTTFHLAASQETLHASLLSLTDTANLGYSLPGNAYPPINVYTYPLISANPPFPFLARAPVSLSDKAPVDDVYLRSAAGLSHTRTIELLKKSVFVPGTLSCSQISLF